MKKKKLYRVREGAMISGVCQGIADYFDVDSTLVRLVWVIISIFGGAGIGGLIAYVICASIIPYPPYKVNNHKKEDVWDTDDYQVKDDEELK